MIKAPGGLFAALAAALPAVLLLCGMAGRPPARLVENGGYILVEDGRAAAALNPDLPLVPASAAKVVTALAALETLGPGHRFATGFFLAPDGRLFIRGHGDPFMVSEEIRAVAAELKRAGVKRVRAVEMDDSLFAIPPSPPWCGDSLNPYDAVNSALAVNFNTVFVRLDGGRVVSAEDQTPTLAMMAMFADRLTPGGGPQRFNVTAAGPGYGPLYAARLFAAILAEQGIETGDECGEALVPAGLAPILVHRSTRPLRETVRAMLLYSNNFIANQLFLVMGMKRYGPPATWDKGRRALAEFLEKRLGPHAGEITMVEGSGLSRANRVSCRGLARVLELFRPYAGLLPEKNGCRLKSGTMTGVYAYAGYIGDGDGPAAVIILNQEKNTRDALLRRLSAIATGRGKHP